MKKLGKYEITGKLGKGAMGMVYQGRDTVLGRVVALKTMLEGVDQDEEMSKRFLVEAQAAARLNHENIITIYDLGREEDTVFIAMEYLDGNDLKELRKERDLSLPEKLNILLQICRGLEYAHKNGVVHRDIKPANVMVLRTGKVKLMDFGIAHMASSDMTKTGMIIGTPDYMSPEQVIGKKVDNRSDIFSVGIIFYELMADKKPFFSESVTTILYKIAHEPLPTFDELNVDVPIEVETIIMKAVEKEPEKRYQDIGEMIKDLQSVIDLYGEKKMATQPALQNEIKSLIEEGKSLMKARKYQNAAELYNKALSLDPDNSVLKRLLDKVEAELVKTKKGDIDGILKQAEKLVSENKFKEAINMAESSFDILPENTTAKVFISKAQSLSAEYEKNKLFADQLKKVRTLIEKEKFIDALKETKILEDIDPSSDAIKKITAEINSLRDKADDKKQINMMLSHVEENIRIKNFPEAEKALSAALAINPEDADALKVKAKLEKALEKLTDKEKTMLASAGTGDQKTVVDSDPNATRVDSGSMPTVVATPTAKTRQVDIDSYDETVAAPSATEFEKTKVGIPVKEKPAKKKSPLPAIIAILAIVGITVGLYFSGVLTGPEVTESGPVDTPEPIAAGKGEIFLNVVPWATIESITDESNINIEVAQANAPCRLRLPAGKYRIVLSNPELNQKKEVELAVEDGATNTYNLNLTEWDEDFIMKELGIE